MPQLDEHVEQPDRDARVLRLEQVFAGLRAVDRGVKARLLRVERQLFHLADAEAPRAAHPPPWGRVGGGGGGGVGGGAGASGGAARAAWAAPAGAPTLRAASTSSRAETR